MNNIDVTEELHNNALSFGYEANCQRAFPDPRDGLKPGQRACLWEMYIKGFSSSKPHVKSAKISGGVISTWWPHGDTAIYETFTRMSQNWINNICEVDWHGNNGTVILSAEPAHQRYTEARLSTSSEEGFFAGIKKRNVPMKLNFSEDEEWPVVLPAIFPRLYVNGCQGIGYTVANTWLPGNLNELTEVIKKYIETGEIDYSNLYPDFPSKGIIINKDDISSIYKTGKGKCILRGRAEIKNNKILITELPYQVYVESFINEIKDLIVNNEIGEIAEINNKSSKKKILIEIICKDAASANTILSKLYSSTSLQKSYSANQMALVGKTPKMLTLKDYIDIYIQHNIECIRKEYEFDLDKAQKRIEIVEGLLKALVHIDDIIKLIKESENSTSAKHNLIITYFFTESQAKAIIDMKLGRLAKLESIELEKEKAELEQNIEDYKSLLNSESNQKQKVLERLINFTKKYGYARRTEVAQITVSKAEKEIENIPPEDCVVVISKSHTIKRVPANNYKVQKRGGKGVKNNEDITAFSLKTNTIDNLMIFSSKGKMYKLLVDKIPRGTNSSKGALISSLVTFDDDEYPMAYASLDRNSTEEYVFFVTKNGIIKKVPIEEYNKTKKSGIIAITLREGDSLASVTFIEKEPMLLITKEGRVIKIETKDLSPASRVAQGVKGVNLNENDSVLTCLPIKSQEDNLIIITKAGQGKRVSLNEFNSQNRGGKGVICSSEKIAGACLANEQNNLLIIGNKSSLVISVADLPLLNRSALGNIVIKDNTVESISKIQ